MKEFKDLPKEKQQELLEVKECCKISENEFEKSFDALSFDDKKCLINMIVDTDYNYGGNSSIDKKILLFLKKSKNKDIMMSCLMDLEMREGIEARLNNLNN
jgi:hypothetical protein